MAQQLQPEPGHHLSQAERDDLAALDVPARLATLDEDGFPRITPLWFLWSEGAFYMTSVPGRRHLVNLERDSRAAICIDTEGSLTNSAGVRPNRMIKARGHVELSEDVSGEWTRRITLKYVSGEVGQTRADLRAAMPRTVMRLAPERLVAIGTATTDAPPA